MKKLKELIAEKGTIVCPGAWDSLSALIIEKAGFDVVFITGLSLEASDLGMPDLGLATASEVVRKATNIVQSVNVPVICDIDTGYGDVKNVWRTIREMEAAGVSGVQLEDQVSPKKDGFLTGRKVLPVEDYLKKLRAALDARRTEDFIIIARTDAKESIGFEEVIRRLNIYADNGADMAMHAEPNSFDEYKRLVKEVKIPILGAAAMGNQPAFTVKEWEEMGVKMVVYWEVPFCAAIKAATKAVQMLRAEGSVEQMRGELSTYEEYAEVVKLSRWLEMENKYG
jgi:methylisocitrate lyase